MAHEHRTNDSKRVQGLNDVICQTLVGVTGLGVSGRAESASGDAVNAVATRQPGRGGGVVMHNRKNASAVPSSGLPICGACVGLINVVTPSLLAAIQRLNQFLNQRTELRRVRLICHCKTKFSPVLLHDTSHSHLRLFPVRMRHHMEHVWYHHAKWFGSLGSPQPCV